jgi:hypothetical protein
MFHCSPYCAVNALITGRVLSLAASIEFTKRKVVNGKESVCVTITKGVLDHIFGMIMENTPLLEEGFSIGVGGIKHSENHPPKPLSALDADEDDPYNNPP